MNRHPIILAQALIACLTLLGTGRGLATDTDYGRTMSDILNLQANLILYKSKYGRFPNTDNLSHELTEARLLKPSATIDSWGQPFIVRIPGSHGPIDVHSIGADGIDNDGAGDDISSWARVNDGYYGRRGWPKARFIILLGAGLLVAAFWFLRLDPNRPGPLGTARRIATEAASLFLRSSAFIRKSSSERSRRK